MQEERYISKSEGSWGWPARCLASVALCVLAACSSSDSVLLATRPHASEPGVPPLEVPNAPPRSVPHAAGAEGQVPASGQGEPDPNATETNFFRIGCDEDSDCLAGERCNIPADAGAPPLSHPSDAGVALDAGGDAGEERYPRGVCLPISTD